MHVDEITTLLSLFCEANDKSLKTYLGKAARRAVHLFTEHGVEHTHKPGPNTYDRLSKEEKAACNAGRLIAAIKAYRERTGLGLRDSKQAVEWLAYGAGKPGFLGGANEPVGRRYDSNDPRFIQKR